MESSTTEPTSQPAQLTAPPGDRPSLVDPIVAVEPKFEWFWCTHCFIVTERSGTCPSCARQVTAVTGDALPYGPYHPPTAPARTKTAKLAPLFAIALITVAIGTGSYLYRAGAPLGGTGASANTVAVAHTPLDIPVLGRLTLTGQWVADSVLNTQLTQAFAAQHGAVNLAVTDGSNSFGVVTLGPATAGGDSTKTVGELLIIDGYQTIRVDSSEVNASTGIRTTTRQYVVQLDDKSRLIIYAASTLLTPHLGDIEKALLAYPNSRGPEL